jgi:hypothetical protein
MIGLDYRVETSGIFGRSITQTGQLLNRNVTTAVNAVSGAAHKIITGPIPSGPSGLKKSIKLQRAKISTATARIDTRHPLMHLVEEDTDPHVIRPRGSVSDMVAGTAKKALRFKYKGKIRFAKSVNHPGTKGKRSWEKANRYVKAHLKHQIDMAIRATIDGRELPRIDAAILSALAELL